MGIVILRIGQICIPSDSAHVHFGSSSCKVRIHYFCISIPRETTLNLRLLSQLSLFGSVIMASLILAYAEGVLFPQGLTVPIALVAYYVTEQRKMFSLSTFWANALGLLAIFLAGSELFFGTVEARLLSGAHLLVYLMWIVLFQVKEQRHRWGLITLSLLQVSVGAVLTQDGSYGLLLLFFLFTSIWTLSLFWMQQVQGQFANSPHNLDAQLQNRPHETKAGSEQSAYAVYLRTSYSQNSVCSSRGESWVTWRFVFGVVGNMSGALIISSLFFVLVPRHWIGSTSFADAAVRTLPALGTLTGFTEEVQLGDFGKILESNEKALEIKLYNHQTNEPMDVEQYTQSLGYEEPYFRGTVLETYNRGRWKLNTDIPEHWNAYDKPDRTRAVVRQEVTRFKLGTDKLFAIHPFIAGASNLPNRPEPFRISIDSNRQYLRLRIVSDKNRRKISQQRLQYNSYSPMRLRKVPTISKPIVSKAWLLESVYVACTEVPQEHLPYLTELTRKIVEQGPAEETEIQLAKRLEAFLRDSGEYTYTLNTSIMDTTIDPVDDFLKNRKSGHCEYYASALTLMLRTANIPARMVNGFKGGTKNRFNDVFEVEQRHAHAWVEAYIGGTWAIEPVRNGRGRWFMQRRYKNGYWVVFDATPAAARASSVQSLNSSMPSWHELRSSISTFWNEYIVQMSISRQQNSFYRPLQEMLSKCMKSLTIEDANGKSFFSRIASFVLSPEKWFSLTGAIVSFGLMMFITLVAWLVSRFSPHFRKFWRSHRNASNVTVIQVEFYERFKKLCAAKGLTRETTETQREFVQKVEQIFQPELNCLGNPNFLEELVEWFYYVRFGEAELQPNKQHSINNMLTQLETLPPTVK